MPTIRSQANGGVIRWDSDDWLAGMVPYFDVDETNTFIGKGFTKQIAIDPYRKFGALSPGHESTDCVGVANVDVVVNCSTRRKGVASALIGVGNDIWQFDPPDIDTTSKGDVGLGGGAQRTVVGGGSNLLLEDMATIDVSGTTMTYYSWNDTGGGDIGRYNGTVWDDDYVSTSATGGATLSNNFSHPMVIGSDRILYIGNGENLASYDPVNNTFNGSALDIEEGYEIKTYAKTKDFLVIFAQLSTNATEVVGGTKAYFWDYVSSTFIYEYDLPGNEINGGFIYKGTVGCFVKGQTTGVGNSKNSKLMIFNGNGFDTIHTFTEDIPIHNGVQVFDDSLMWNAGGAVYQWGTPFKGAPVGINKIGQGAGTTSGLLRAFSKNTVTYSSGTTTSGGFQDLYYGVELFEAAAEFRTVAATPPSALESRFRVKAVKCYWHETTGSGVTTAEMTLKLVVRRGNTEITIFDDTDTFSISSTAAKDDFITIFYKADNNEGAYFPHFSSIALHGTYNVSDTTKTPPILRAIEVYYEDIRYKQ